MALKEIASLDLDGHITATRAASLKLAEAVEPLINEKLEILQSAGRLADKIKDEINVLCPACGREISVTEFQKHVANESARLREILNSFEARKRGIATCAPH